MNKALVPILIITGLFLLDILKLNIPSFSLSEKHQTSLAGSGAWGAFSLGLVFALAFCPISAALFFGSLIPLALNTKIGPILPFIYGIGTSIPVFVFAFAIALGVSSLNHWFHRLTKIEYYARKITGIIFLAVGAYYIFVYIVNVF